MLSADFYLVRSTRVSRSHKVCHQRSMKTLPDTPRAGLILVTTAFLFAPGLDVFAKLLTAFHSPGQVALGRFLLQTLLLLPLMFALRAWARPVWGHGLAGAFLALALLCFNAALEVMPIANAIAIFFVEPLLLTVLSAVVLGEQIGWRRVLAVLIGLIGAMIVIRPNWVAFGPAAVLPLGTAVFFAGYMLVTKRLVAGGRPLALQFWTGIAATVVLAVACLTGTGAGVAVLTLTPLATEAIGYFLGMAVIAVIGHQMLVLALARVDASVIAPMQYLEIFSAVVFGWLIFDDFPDGLTWFGTAIIIASGVYVFHREARAGQMAGPPAVRAPSGHP